MTKSGRFIAENHLLHSRKYLFYPIHKYIEKGGELITDIFYNYVKISISWTRKNAFEGFKHKYSRLLNRRLSTNLLVTQYFCGRMEI